MRIPLRTGISGSSVPCTTVVGTRNACRRWAHDHAAMARRHTEVFLEVPRADASANARLLASGLAYPAFYTTLPAQLRTHFAGLSRAAREADPAVGLWPRSTADPDGPARIADLAGLEQLVLWPKLFRRIVPYLAAGFRDFDGFDAWLRADPVGRDDELFLLDRLESGNLHDVIRAAGDSVQLTTWPEDFIIRPDP